MNIEETCIILERIISDYEILPYPKYRNADIDSLKKDYVLLMEIKEYQKSNPRYKKIVNAVSQAISKICRKTNDWRIVSERGINKTIPPIVRKKNKAIEFPFEWTDNKTGYVCCIKDYWGAKNYMVMDIIGHYLLLKNGGDLLPVDAAPVFNTVQSIAERESIINDSNGDFSINKLTTDDYLIQRIHNARFDIKFTDKDFRKSSSQDLSSNEIMNILLETSRVEFKLVYPVRLWNSKKARETTYSMNFFSRLFEFGYIDREIRSDGIVTLREYHVIFNTFLGELFAHNLLSRSYDWIGNNFYNLPCNAQVFYRMFLLNNNYKSIPINIDTIKRRLNLAETNITNLKKTIENNILSPLISQGLIDSYREEKKGLYGLKFIIKRSLGKEAYSMPQTEK